MANSTTWFTASKQGLQKLVEHLPKEMIIYELVQNTWDEDATFCRITIERIPGSAFVRITCEDDVPQGFKHLDHAFTIWAESEKKNDPTKRGRFNEGEKKVLALCRKAEISTTTGTVVFHEDGRRTQSSRKTEAGSVFMGELRMTHTQVLEVERAFHRLIPPSDCETTLNGVTLEERSPVATFEETLPTFNMDGEGHLRPTKRQTVVNVYEPEEDEEAMLYECGIPVVATGDHFHVSVEQKVPLNRDRDNVTPAFLRKVRAAVLRNTIDLLDEESISNKGIDDAMEDPSIDAKVLKEVLIKRHGKKHVFHDKGDTEANSQLFGEGYSVLGRGTYSSSLRKKILDAGAGQKAGQLRPTPTPFSSDPNAEEMKVIPEDKWTQGMKEVAAISRWMAKELRIHEDLLVRFGRPPTKWWAASWGVGLTWNVTALKNPWFDTWYEHPRAVLDLLIHEFSHSGGAVHLQDRFHENCTKIGSRMAMLMSTRARKIPHWRRVRDHIKAQEAA